MVQAVERRSDIDYLKEVNQQPPVFAAVEFRLDSTLSSIEELQTSSLIKRVLYAPFSLLNRWWKKLKSFIGNYIFFCYASCRDPINWGETKLVFEKIYNVIIKRDEYTSSKDQKARFKEALSELSDDALARFKFHIGTCRAQMADSSMTSTQRAAWYEKNKGSIDFKRDYFDSISGNTILENAVKCFWKEIQSRA